MKPEDVKCLCGHPRWLHERRMTPHEYEDCRSKGCGCTHYMAPEGGEVPDVLDCADYTKLQASKNRI